MSDVARDLIIERLEVAGWKPSKDKLGAAVATKEYNTYVGVKVAFAYIYDTKDSLTLRGDYQSEGRNILESNMLTIQSDSKPEDLRAATEKWAKQAEFTVNDSYAMRLARPKDEQDGSSLGI